MNGQHIILKLCSFLLWTDVVRNPAIKVMEGAVLSEEIIGVLEVSIPRDHIHPLLILLVVEKVFSNLGKRDLLAVRTVCADWYDIATETYVNRKDIVKTTDLNESSIQSFIDVMTTSKRIPVVRWIILIDQLSIPLPAFIQFLTFIAPFVKGIKVVFTTVDVFEDTRAANEFLTQLGNLDTEPLMMSELEDLEVMGNRMGINHSVLRETLDAINPVMIKLTQNMLVGAKSLKCFACTLPCEPTDGIIQALPQGLKTLRFLNVDGRSIGRNVPYSTISDARLELHEIQIASQNLDHLGDLIEFLSTQKYRLRQVDISDLPAVYRQLYITFPQLNLVDKLGCEVSFDSTFEFLKPFPNVIELIIRVRCDVSRHSSLDDTERNLHYLPKHPSVSRLHIASSVIDRPMDDMVSIKVLAHCFPNLTHLTTVTSMSVRFLRDIFIWLPNIEWWYLDFSYATLDRIEGESVFAGIPSQICQTMNAVHNYDDTGDEGSYGVGLINMKRLETLEVRDKTHRFRLMFSELTIARVFSKMESLKQICFVDEEEMPEVLLPFVLPLQNGGFDLYRMKRRVEMTL